MRIALAAVVLSGCGRVAFDPAGDGGASSGDTIIAPLDPTLLLSFQFAPAALLADTATGHDATCTSCPVATQGPRPGLSAGDFDGVADCLYVDLPLAMRPSNVTFALWMRRGDTRNEMFFGVPFMGGTSILNSFQIFASDPSEVEIELSGVFGRVITPVDEWHHIAGTYDGANLGIYRDGVRIHDVGASSLSYSNEKFMIGCDIDFATEMWHVFGQIADVRLYSRALSTAEIAALAQ